MAEPTCAKCGAALLPTGVCSSCGHNAYVDLEIGAFMAPHINRARIVLVLMGALYLAIGIMAYSDISKIRDAMDAWSKRGHSAELDQYRHAVQLAYITVIAAIAIGAANIALAAIAGKKTMLAFNVALGLFIVHTALQAYATDGVIFTSFLWWITAIFLGMGYQAARKAEKLRAGNP